VVKVGEASNGKPAVAGIKLGAVRTKPIVGPNIGVKTAGINAVRRTTI
jgi:hypothetical protein